MQERWSLFIDIEGFSQLYRKKEVNALILLSNLMKYIYKIGSIVYNNDTNRLFVYQIGDGFIITPNFEKDPNRAISIALVLMRLMLMDNGVTRAAISTGRMSDITGFYPDDILKKSNKGSISLGSGIMTINPVMGDALINAYKLENKNIKGPLLLIDSRLEDYFINDPDIIIHKNNNYYYSINWIYSAKEETNMITKKIGEKIKSGEILSKQLEKYIEDYDLPNEWELNAKELISL